MKAYPISLAALTIVLVHSGEVRQQASQFALPLRVSDHGRYLVDSAGRPFFWLGDSAWLLFQAATRSEADLYLRTRARQGFTVIQAALVMGVEGLEAGGVLGPNPYGDPPFLGDDPARPLVTPGRDFRRTEEYDYWDHADYIVERAAAHGVVLGLSPLFVGGRDEGLESLSVDSAYAYGTFLGRRYGHHAHLFWILGGDSRADTEAKLDIWHQLARGLTIGVSGLEDYQQTLMTYHPSVLTSSSRWVHEAPWLDFNMIQVESTEAEAFQLVDSDYRLTPARPTGIGQGPYESGPQGPVDVLTVRRHAYGSYLAGGYFTYGNASVWHLGAQRTGIAEDWMKALDSPGATQLSILASVFTSIAWWTLVPDRSIAAGGAGGSVAMRSDGGAPIVVYLRSPSTVSVRLDAAWVREMSATWIDPETGARSPALPVPGRPDAAFSTPAGWSDALLLLAASRADTMAGFRRLHPGNRAPIGWLDSIDPDGTASGWASSPRVIYDNDGAVESGYTDVFVYALASAGAIDLKGIVTTNSYAEEERTPPFAPLSEPEIIAERQELVEKARRSGLTNLPDVTAGPGVSLDTRRPASGRIEDTRPFGSSGAWLIVTEARKATAQNPLVIIMGGQATAVADAYLLDNSIADKVVLQWLAGKKSGEQLSPDEYNYGIDRWATYIVLERLRVKVLPFTTIDNYVADGFPLTPKSRLGELPDTEMRQLMVESSFFRGAGRCDSFEADLDSAGAIDLLRRDFVLQTRRFSFSHWEGHPWRNTFQTPVYRPNANGRVLAAWTLDRAVATEEWWGRMKDPAAWNTSVGQRPIEGDPTAVPGTIEVEHFDHGGTGRAYVDSSNNFCRAEGPNRFRSLEHVDVYSSATASKGFKVGSVEAGEWMEYTVNVSVPGVYGLEARVASRGGGGRFHVEFNGVDRTGPLRVPNTGGWDTWRTVSKAGLTLSEGTQVVRLVMDRNGPTGFVGDFDSLTLTLQRPLR